MRFLLDANLAPALALRIVAAGHDCEHLTRFLAPGAGDREVAELANRIGAVLISKDADFIQLKMGGTLQNAFVWLRYGNMSNRRTADRLLAALPGIVKAVGTGEGILTLW